jgi:hypothetical protein
MCGRNRVNKIISWTSAGLERVNPIVVKEFRQAVQSRLVIVILTIFLLVNLAVVGGYLLMSPEAATSATGGREVFTGLLVVLLLTCIVFVPLYVGTRLSLERNDANIDLFFITTLSPGAIVRGKYAAAMALTLLIFSACMPFIVFTYLLRGVDLTTIGYSLLFGFLVCAAFNALGVFGGCVPASWTMRAIIGVVVGLFTLWGIGLLISAITAISMFGMGPMTGAPGGWSFWAAVGTWLLLELLGIGLLHVFSVAMLSPKPANRMLVPHLYITALWAITGVVSFLWAWNLGHLGPFEVWRNISCGVFLWLMVCVLGERDTWSARIRKRIPHDPFARLVAFLFYTGSAGALLWCILMFASTLVLFEFGGSAITLNRVHTPFSGTTPEETRNFLIVAGYVLSYCFTTAALRTSILRRAPTVVLPLVATMMGVALLLGPVLLEFFLSTRGSHDTLSWCLLASPLVLTTSNQQAIAVAETLVTVWVILSGVAAAAWIIGQWLRFVPYRGEQRDEGLGIRD